MPIRERRRCNACVKFWRPEDLSMPQPAGHDGRQLQTLERVRRLALEEAQAIQTQCEAEVAQGESQLTLIETALQAAYGEQRLLMEGGSALSRHALQISHDYRRLQAAALDGAAAALAAHRGRLAQAQRRVNSCLKDVKVIERLSERRRRAQHLLEQHSAQARLDELGIIKYTNRKGPWPSPE
jgi:flagellar biosynthesis chaperone FliJ